MRKAGAILLVIVGTVAVVAISGRGGAPTIQESANAISVQAWGYSQEIPYATIDSVTLRHGLDGLRGRRSAMQSGNSYAGRFSMEPYGEAMLFVDALREPLVVIHAKSGVTLLSAADSVSAEQLAVRLRAAAHR
jgi:hypothetical protein